MKINVGLAGMLFLVFLVLKLTDHIDWSWFWIILPLWWPLALFLGTIAFGAVLAAVAIAIAAIVDKFR